MTYEEFRQSLEQKTYADIDEVWLRVFYALTDVSEGESIKVSDASTPTKLHQAAHRQAVFISLLSDKLESKGILLKAEIESLLFDTVGGPGSSKALQ